MTDEDMDYWSSAAAKYITYAALLYLTGHLIWKGITTWHGMPLT